MKFFKFKPNEKVSIAKAKESCVHEGLSIEVSRKALGVLLRIASEEDLEKVSMTFIMALERRGFIMQKSDGKWVLTELGFHACSFAEALNLFNRE